VGGDEILPDLHRGRFVKARFSRDILKNIGLAAWVALSSVLSASAQDFCQPDHECCQVDTKTCCTPATPAPSPHSDRLGPDCTCNHAGQSQTARPSSTSGIRADQRKERTIAKVATEYPAFTLKIASSATFGLPATSLHYTVSLYRLTSRWRC